MIFQQLLTKDKTLSVYPKNWQVLAIEIYKVKNKISPEFVNDIFHFTDRAHDHKNKSTLRKKIDTVAYFDFECIYSLAITECQLVLESIKNEKSLSSFKRRTNPNLGGLFRGSF